MKKLALGAAFAALTVALPTAAPAQRLPTPVIVVVDTDRIYRECTACRAAQTQIQGLVTSAQQRGQQLGQPLQTEMQSIQQAAQAARAQQGAARTAAETQLQTRMQALQQRENTANQELQRLEQNIQSTRAHVLQQLNTRLQPIIQQVMTQRNANLALDTGATLARGNGLDVTDAVLAALNAALPSVSVTPLPQQQPAPGQPQPQRPQGR
jgi:Skp family chaperone for outer membrane proteins